MRYRGAVLAAALMFGATVAASADSTLRPGDKIDVNVFNHPELSGKRTLDASGNVSLPVAGTISALNVGVTDVAARVRERLVPYVRNVAVQVQLDAQGGSIFVAGGPNGVIPFAAGLTLASIVDRLNQRGPAPVPDAANQQQIAPHDVAMSTLGLENGPIDFRRVGVLRDGKTLGPFDIIALRQSGGTGVVLQPGDTIQLVNKAIKVEVTGDVGHPGLAYLDAKEPLSQALTQVGGAAASARVTDLQLVRDGTSQLVSLGSPVFSEPARDNDRLVVPRATRVDVLGTVVKPGDTLLRGDTTLVSAIYYAGGPAKFANLRAVQVIHQGQKKVFDLRRLEKGGNGENPQLSDGDVVFVPQGSTFQWSDIWSGLGALGLFGVKL